MRRRPSSGRHPKPYPEPDSKRGRRNESRERLSACLVLLLLRRPDGAIRRAYRSALLRWEGFELEGQLVDLAGELEGRVVAIFHQRDPGAGILADVEGFVLWEHDRGGMFQRIPRHLL